jgi:hypothetical protein
VVYCATATIAIMTAIGTIWRMNILRCCGLSGIVRGRISKFDSGPQAGSVVVMLVCPVRMEQY